MPSSADHCNICTFAAFEAADAEAAVLESICVGAHMLVLAEMENESSDQAPHIDIANERIVAARGCAKVIWEGHCPRFVGVVGHQTQDNKAQVFFMARGDAPS